MFGQYHIKQGYNHPVWVTAEITRPMAPFTGIYNLLYGSCCCSFVAHLTDSLWFLFSNNDYLMQKSSSKVPLIPFKLPKLLRVGQTVKRGADLQSEGQSSENTRSGCELWN